MMTKKRSLVRNGLSRVSIVPYLTLAALLVVGQVMAMSGVNTAGMLKGVTASLTTAELSRVEYAVPGRDNSLWLIVNRTEYSYTPGRWERKVRVDWLVRRFDKAGRHWGHDVILSSQPSLRGLWSIRPIGVNAAGSLVLRACGWSPDNNVQKYVLVTPRGISGVSQPMGLASYAFFGLKDTMFVRPNMWNGLLKMEGKSGKFEVTERYDYSALFGNRVSDIPSHLAWGATSGRFATVAEPNRIALAMVPADDTLISFYRFDPATLSLIDSVAIHPANDAYRTYENVHLTTMKLIKAEDGGYWLYAPGPGAKLAVGTDVDSSSTARVYRLDADLTVLHSDNMQPESAGSVAQLPSGAQLDVQGGTWETGRQRLAEQFREKQHLRLEFVGFDRQGRFYFTAEEDSLDICIPAASGGEGGR